MLLSKILHGCKSVVKFGLKESRFMFFALFTKFEKHDDLNFCKGNQYMTCKFIEETGGLRDKDEEWMLIPCCGSQQYEDFDKFL